MPWSGRRLLEMWLLSSSTLLCAEDLGSERCAYAPMYTTTLGIPSPDLTVSNTDFTLCGRVKSALTEKKSVPCADFPLRDAMANL